MTLTENLLHPGTSDISTPLELAVGTHFYVQLRTKTTPVFLPVYGETSWLLLPSSVSLLSGSKVQPQNTYQGSTYLFEVLP